MQHVNSPEGHKVRWFSGDPDLELGVLVAAMGGKVSAKISVKTRVTTVTCPQCGIELYSRAHHDFRGCKCGTFVDGGFSYMRYGWPNGYDRPVAKIRYVPATRRELYDDWNQRINASGVIQKKAKK